jgi:hypothetical protein
VIQATAMRYRARDVSKVIDGTTREVSEFASKAEIDDPDFAAEFENLMERCEDCGTWNKSGEECDTPGCENGEGWC